MAMRAAGLQSYIWNNNLKSGLLLVTYPLVIGALVWAVAWVIGSNISTPTVGLPTAQIATMRANNFIFEYWPAILTVIVIWFTIAYFFNTRMVRALSHSHPVTRAEEPELYNLLENLCIARGMKMPRLEIIETHARNAFASGVNEKSYTVTVTRGLMNALQKDELEGVLAHELTHIINRDVRLLIITIIFTGMIGFAAQMAWSQLRYGFVYSGRNRRNGGGAMVLLAIAVILWVGYLATLFTRFAISRRREYMADAGAVEITKNPEGMMRALMRIAGRAQIPQTTDDIAMMCIENKNAFLGLFATHPPIEKRIAALSTLTGAAVPENLSLGPAEKRARFIPEKRNRNPWLTQGRR